MMSASSLHGVNKPFSLCSNAVRLEKILRYNTLEDADGTTARDKKGGGEVTARTG